MTSEEEKKKKKEFPTRVTSRAHHEHTVTGRPIIMSVDWSWHCSDFTQHRWISQSLSYPVTTADVAHHSMKHPAV